MEQTDPEMAEEIRKKMFTFENLVALDGRSLQMILREVNNDSLTLAFEGCIRANERKNICQHVFPCC